MKALNPALETPEAGKSSLSGNGVKVEAGSVDVAGIKVGVGVDVNCRIELIISGWWATAFAWTTNIPIKPGSAIPSIRRIKNED